MRRRIRGRLVLYLLVVTPLAPAACQAPASPVSLVDYSRDLPQHLPSANSGSSYTAYMGMLQAATPQDRATAIPLLLRWADDDRVAVRSQALTTMALLAIPPEGSHNLGGTLSPAAITVIAAHLHDSDPSVRPLAYLALTTGAQSPNARQILLPLVLPLLQAPDALTAYPDHRNDAGHEGVLRGVSPADRVHLDAHYTQPTYPALGPQLLWLMLGPTASQSSDAVILFLDRPDQTAATLSESVRAIALNHAEERVNDQALRRAFELHAISVFLIQFLPSMQLTPQHLAQHKNNLLAVANDPSQPTQLRHAAATVAACWNGDIHQPCSPDPADFVQHDSTNQVPQ